MAKNPTRPLLALRGSRAGSSVGQSSGLIIRSTQVRVLPGPSDSRAKFWPSSCRCIDSCSTFVFPTGPRMCPAHAIESRPTGHLQVKGPKGRRAWFALWRDADGRHQRRLGPAHVRDSGRRTPRGAIVWRAANGSEPDPTYLTPAEAEAALEQLLAEG